MSQDSPTYLVELFIKTLQLKHKLTFEKDKEQYFRVLFDTYLNGQGNAAELKEYIAAGIEDQDVINKIAEEVIQWQGKAEELKAQEQAKKSEKELEKEKINEFVANRTKKLREEAEKERKERGDNPRKKHKGEKASKQQDAKQNEEVKPEQAEAKEEAPVGNEDHGEGEGNEEGEGGHEGKGVDRAGLKYELQQSGREKCRYYPFCKNLEKCPYFHPSQRVDNFFVLMQPREQ